MSKRSRSSVAALEQATAEVVAPFRVLVKVSDTVTVRTQASGTCTAGEFLASLRTVVQDDFSITISPSAHLAVGTEPQLLLRNDVLSAVVDPGTLLCVVEVGHAAEGAPAKQPAAKRHKESADLAGVDESGGGIVMPEHAPPKPHAAPPANSEPNAAPADSKPDAAPADSKPHVAPAVSKPDVAPQAADSKSDAALADSNPHVAPAVSKPDAAPQAADSKPDAAPAITAIYISPGLKVLCVEHSNRTVTFVSIKPTDCVADVKNRLVNGSSTPADRIHLFCEGRQMNNRKALSDYIEEKHWSRPMNLYSVVSAKIASDGRY